MKKNIGGQFNNRTFIRNRFILPDQRDPTKELEFFRGDDINLIFQITDECADIIDLTDYQIFFTIKCFEADEQILFQINSDDDPSNVVKLNAPEGTVQVTVPSAVSKDLPPRHYYFDVQLVSPDGKISTVIKDVFIIKYDITIA